MQALICRVSRAFVERDQERVAGIADGMLVLVSVDRRDDDSDIEWMVQRLCDMRGESLPLPANIREAPDAETSWSACSFKANAPSRWNRREELLFVSSEALADGLNPHATFGVWEPAEPEVSQRMVDQLAKRCGQGVHVGHHDLGTKLTIVARLEGPVVNVLDSKHPLRSRQRGRPMAMAAN